MSLVDGFRIVGLLRQGDKSIQELTASQARLLKFSRVGGVP